MASIVTHAALALVLGKTVTAAHVPRTFWIWMVALSVGPDLDVIGFALGANAVRKPGRLELVRESPRDRRRRRDAHRLRARLAWAINRSHSARLSGDRGSW